MKLRFRHVKLLLMGAGLLLSLLLNAWDLARHKSKDPTSSILNIGFCALILSLLGAYFTHENKRTSRVLLGVAAAVGLGLVVICYRV